jgi:uncharacterized protein (TIGR02271 family)
MHHDATQVQQGWTVYDSNREKVGDVEETGQGWVLVTKGLIFIKDVYIPTSAFTTVDTSRQAAFLEITKDQVDGMGWDQPATETGTEAVASGSDASTVGGSDEATRLRLHEEELQAGTRREEVGEVDVRKRVVESEQQIDVPVEHDELQVRRVRVDREAVPGEAAFTDDGETIRVPMTAETVEVTKQPRVVEEIEIFKRPVTETQRVGETVRREEVEVEREGDVRLVDDDAGVDSGLVGAGSDRTQRTDILDEDRTTERGF